MKHLKLITKYFPELTDLQIDQLVRLPELYSQWNSKINLISRKDIETIEERHILHSLGIAKVINFKSGTRILDVGTGGGFPGIPLAIIFPNVHFHLVDSIGKKIIVVKEIASVIGLKNLNAHHERAEDVVGLFDFVVSRAVTAMPKFHRWVKNKISKSQQNDLKNGILYLKGGDLSEELSGFARVQQYDLANYFTEPFFETKKVVYLPVKMK